MRLVSGLAKNAIRVMLSLVRAVSLLGCLLNQDSDKLPIVFLYSGFHTDTATSEFLTPLARQVITLDRLLARCYRCEGRQLLRLYLLDPKGAKHSRKHS